MERNKQTKQNNPQTEYLHGVEYLPISSFGCIESPVRSVLSTAANKKQWEQIYSRWHTHKICPWAAVAQLVWDLLAIIYTMQAHSVYLIKTQQAGPAA